MDEQEFDSDAEDDGDQQTVFGVAFDWGEEESELSEGAGADVLRFELGGLVFAVEAAHVTEVEIPQPLTEVPGLPAHVLGVVVRRRHVLSIIDLAVFLGLPSRETPSTRLLVFEADGLEAGIIVGNVAGLEVWLEDADVPNLDDLDDRVRRYVVASRWAPGGRVLLLDMPELLRAAAVR